MLTELGLQQCNLYPVSHRLWLILDQIIYSVTWDIQLNMSKKQNLMNRHMYGRDVEYSLSLTAFQPYRVINTINVGCTWTMRDLKDTLTGSTEKAFLGQSPRSYLC